jgi:uncharacterized protein with ATP-grasp and redox domains
MQHDDRCFDCLMSRVRLEATLAGVDPERFREVFGHAAKLLAFLHNTPYTHTVVASLLHRSVYHHLNTRDPFIELKNQSTEAASAVIEIIRDDLCGFKDLVTAAVIGNIFDYGVKGHTIQDDFLSFFRNEYAKGLYIDDTAEILPLCRRVVYFTDNCGEILFDRLLISFLKEQGSHITLVVRDAPILNDATMNDAEATGLSEIVDDIHTTSSGAELGIRFDLLGPEVRNALEECSILIAKGMANYESLREEEGLPPVAYLLAAKCEPIAEELQVPRGSKLALLRR